MLLDFWQPMGSPSLRVAAGLLCLSLGLLPASAQYTNYNYCPSACAPDPTSSTCVYNCNDCLVYGTYNCYTTFTPSFAPTGNGNQTVYQDYDCSCSTSWSWWSWTLLVIGISLVVGMVVYGILACMRRRKMQKDAAYQQQQMAATGGAPPPYPGSEAYAPGQPVTGYPAGPGYGWPPPPQGYPGAPPPVYQATAPAPGTAAPPPNP